MAVTEAGDGPAAVFCHGFPEIAYSWRKQIPAVAAAGFRAVAPDQRGYGDMIAGCGHWTQQEKPAELNAIMIDWLSRRSGTR